LPALSFRFFNVFGSGQDASSPYSGVISLFARESAAGRSLKILGDGNQTRDFVAVEDLVDACARVLDLDASKLQGQAVNLGSGQAVRISELAGLVQKISGSTRSLERGPTREGDVRHSLADIRAASALLGWKPSTSLEAGLRTLS
jgi:UDP-glucose 4-epimerase